MASYKIIQDIEAEDKLVGPLTLRQFIYAGIAAFCAYLSFVAVGNGFSLALIVLVPPMVFTGFFAFPWGRDQPTEVWALAKIRYYLKSRKRLWDQSGVKDLVNITAPKHDTKQYTNGLSLGEVQNRLSALASTLDTRGWAVKNVYSVPPLIAQADTDRLIDISTIPQEVPAVGLTAADDMLDTSNPTAQHLQQMVATSTANHKQRLMTQMRQATSLSLPTPQTAIGPAAAATNWFVPAAAAPVSPIVDTNGLPQATPVTLPAATERELDEELHERRERMESTLANLHLKTIQPLSEQPTVRPLVAPAAPSKPLPQPPVTHTPDPAKIQLAARDDLNIATLARMANKKDGGEVVISLHNHNS